LTEFDTLTVPTRTNGNLEVWREVEGNVFSVYAAKGTTAAGEVRTGFGVSTDEAVISVLHELAAADAQDAPKPIVDYGRLEERARRFAEVYGMSARPDFEVHGTVTGRIPPKPVMQSFPTHTGSSRSTIAPQVLPKLSADFYCALAKSNKIRAIKVARDELNWPLIDAKNFVDSLFDAYQRIRYEVQG
jgi:hypothetical protein